MNPAGLMVFLIFNINSLYSRVLVPNVWNKVYYMLIEKNLAVSLKSKIIVQVTDGKVCAVYIIFEYDKSHELLIFFFFFSISLLHTFAHLHQTSWFGHARSKSSHKLQRPWKNSYKTHGWSSWSCITGHFWYKSCWRESNDSWVPSIRSSKDKTDQGWLGWSLQVSALFCSVSHALSLCLSLSLSFFYTLELLKYCFKDLYC